MPTADANISPSYSPVSPSSARHLEDVGVETVLEAMIEQKRRSSQPSFPAVSELSDEDLHEEDEGPPGGRSPSVSEVFLKAR